MSCGQFDLWIVSDDPADRERALIHAAGCPRCGEIASGQEWLAGEAESWREGVEAPAELEERIADFEKPIIRKKDWEKLEEVEAANAEKQGLEFFKFSTNEEMLDAMGLIKEKQRV